MYPIALLFSLIAASPVAQSSQASPDENMVDTAPPVFTTTSAPAQATTPAFDGPSLSQIKTDWRRDYERMGSNKRQILAQARTNLTSNYIPNTVKQIYSEQGYGTITYLCGVNKTFGRFPIRQHMDIGQGENAAALDVVGDGLGQITHSDGSAVALSSVLNGIPSPVNSSKNGGWFAFALGPVANSKVNKLTGVTYGFRDNVKGGHIPPSCSVVGQESTFNIVATYHLFK